MSITRALSHVGDTVDDLGEDLQQYLHKRRSEIMVGRRYMSGWWVYPAHRIKLTKWAWGSLLPCLTCLAGSSHAAALEGYVRRRVIGCHHQHHGVSPRRFARRLLRTCPFSK